MEDILSSQRSFLLFRLSLFIGDKADTVLIPVFLSTNNPLAPIRLGLAVLDFLQKTLSTKSIYKSKKEESPFPLKLYEKMNNNNSSSSSSSRFLVALAIACCCALTLPTTIHAFSPVARQTGQQIRPEVSSSSSSSSRLFVKRDPMRMPSQTPQVPYKVRRF